MFRLGILKNVIDPAFFKGSIYTILGGELHVLGYVLVILLVILLL